MNYVIVEGGGPVIRVVGDESQGFYTSHGPDVKEVANVFRKNGIWGFKEFDKADREVWRREPLLGTLLAHHVVIAAQYYRLYHTVLNHFLDQDPYGVLIHARDVIGRRMVNLTRLVNLIETKTEA